MTSSLSLRRCAPFFRDVKVIKFIHVHHAVVTMAKAQPKGPSKGRQRPLPPKRLSSSSGNVVAAPGPGHQPANIVQIPISSLAVSQPHVWGPKPTFLGTKCQCHFKNTALATARVYSDGSFLQFRTWLFKSCSTSSPLPTGRSRLVWE